MIFTLVMPAVFYFIFGVSQNYADQNAGRGNVAAYIMISMAALRRHDRHDRRRRDGRHGTSRRAGAASCG